MFNFPFIVSPLYTETSLRNGIFYYPPYKIAVQASPFHVLAHNLLIE